MISWRKLRRTVRPSVLGKKYPNFKGHNGPSCAISKLAQNFAHDCAPFAKTTCQGVLKSCPKRSKIAQSGHSGRRKFGR